MAQTFIHLEDSELFILNFPELSLEEISKRLSVAGYKKQVHIVENSEISSAFRLYCKALTDLLEKYELENLYKISLSVSRNVLWLSDKNENPRSVSFELVSLKSPIAIIYSDGVVHSGKLPKIVAIRMLYDLLIRTGKLETAFHIYSDFLSNKHEYQ
ncbi:hypothetical protein Pam2_81 [Pseudanabaena phage Pam2]|nr:hypothetical protein Pam2_81 [Pseudanabaena phage Pam2]